jgi:outer membrane protein TolC
MKSGNARPLGLQVICVIFASALLLAPMAEPCLGQSAPASTPSSPQAQPLRLTLKEVVQLAMKQNPQVITARLLELESERSREIARSALLPQASLTGATALEQYNFQKVERLPHSKPAGPYQWIEAGPAFSQSVLDLPLIRGYQIGREGVSESKAQERTTREEISSAVVLQYHLVLRAIAVREAARSQVALAERLSNLADHQEKTGVGLAIDATRARVELQNQRQSLIDAETEVRTTLYVLAELLNLPSDQDLEAADVLAFYDLPAYDVSSSIATALATRPEMRAIASEERIAELTRKSAQEQRLPRLEFSGYWLYQGEHFSDAIPAYSYVLGLDIPLFTGGRIRAQIAQADLQQKQVEEKREALVARIVREVKSAIVELDSARSAVAVASLGLQLANEEVAQSERRFAAGVTTNVEVIQAQDALARANDNQIEALFRFNQSRANLARAMGEEENTYEK